MFRLTSYFHNISHNETDQKLCIISILSRIQTSYVSVEPKKKLKEAVKVVRQPSDGKGSRKVEGKIKTQRKAASSASGLTPPFAAAASACTPEVDKYSTKTLPDREMRRARIVITLRRTVEYAQWLHENPQTSGNEAKVEALETFEGED